MSLIFQAWPSLYTRQPESKLNRIIFVKNTENQGAERASRDWPC